MATITIHIALTQLIKQGALFSAFDVTRILRNSGVHIAHHVVRGAVHKAMNVEPSYQKTAVTISGVGSETIVYHPTGSHAAYDAGALDPSFTPAKPVSPATPIVAPTAVLKTATIKPDQDGRLNIPPQFLRAMGIGKLGKVNLIPNHKSVEITPLTGSGEVLSVHQSGGFRVNPRTLIKADIQGYSKYIVQSFPNKIVINRP